MADLPPKPHLTLVDPGFSTEHDQEFIPLPFWSWDERPDSLPLDADECATAIHLSEGDLPAAAKLLRTPLIRLNRLIRHHPRLQRILEEENHLTLARASSEYIRALNAPDDRRREWAATKVLSSRIAIGHPFSPAPAGSATTAIAPIDKTITIHWGAPPADEASDG